MLQVHHLRKTYGAATVLEDISFVLNDGEHVGLVGPNGTGKSTLLRCLVGLEQPDSGSIVLAPLGARIGYLAQSFSDAEEQCEEEYEELLQAIHEDELFAPVDIQRQEQLVEQIAAALPEDKRMLIVELADNHARHVWLQQEGAYHVGLAVGHRLRLKT